jgi:sialic acid synthase SpsE
VCILKFIAECGLNHNGNHDLTYELIRQAAHSGADIAKFQLGWRDKKNEMNNIQPDRIDLIINHCKYMDIEPLFSIINDNAFDMIEPFNLKCIKIASRTVLENPKLVEKILSAGYKTIISLGMWDKKELPFGKSDQIEYLWCVSKYPCLPSDLIGFPDTFRDGPYSGYSDHTLGIEAALLAISRGATIVEKHFSLDKSDTTIRDHVLSASPEEFRNLVSLGKEIEKLVSLGL